MYFVSIGIDNLDLIQSEGFIRSQCDRKWNDYQLNRRTCSDRDIDSLNHLTVGCENGHGSRLIWSEITT